MIESEELGLKIAENPREALIKDTIKNTENRILQIELSLELEKEGLKYLKSL
jgi:hypothetical protein